MGWEKTKKLIIRIKFYIQRTQSYLAIPAYLSMIYLALKEKNLQYLMWFIPLIPFVGWLEDKSGLCREEMELHANRMGLLDKEVK